MDGKYPFMVLIDRWQNHTVSRQTKNFETLGAAVACHDAALRHPATRRVQILAVLADNRATDGADYAHKTRQDQRHP